MTPDRAHLQLPASGAGDPYLVVRALVEAAEPGAIVRAREGRTTLRFDSGGESFYLKYHRGVGWREIFKNLLHARLPVLGASDEYLALRELAAADIPSLVPRGFGSRGLNPARRESFLVTEALLGTEDLRALCRRWRESAPPQELTVALLDAVADLVRGLHRAGIQHRDLYLCHIHVDSGVEPPRCHLIDLHRARRRRRLPRRWREKDLAALWFSVLDDGFPLPAGGARRFIDRYEQGQPLGARFWRGVRRRAQRVLARERRRWLRSQLLALPAESPDRFSVGAEPYVLKCYRGQHGWQRLAMRVGLSRLQRAARIGDAMAARGLPVVPTHALAVVAGDCFAAYRELEGAVELARASSLPLELADSLGRALADVHRAGFFHGDCKWRNILVRDGAPCFIDLDGAGRSHARRRRLRDLARFLLDAEERDQHGFGQRVLAAYASALPADPSTLAADVQQPLRMLRARHQARYGAT